MKCNSGTGNSFTYDPIPESFDEVQIIPDPPPQCHFNIYLCQICESNSHYGYECLQRVSLVYDPKPCYIQNFGDNDYSHDLPSVNPLIDHHCCYECGNSLNDFFCHQCTCKFCGNGAHVSYKCPAQVPSFQTLPCFPQQYPCCEDCGVLPEADHCQPLQYTVNHPIFNIPTCSDDDEDYNFTITSNEPVDSLSMGDEHLNTVSVMESDEFIKSSVENLVPNPSDDDQSLYDEDVPEKIFSNPLFEEEINPMKIDQHHDNAESDLVESLRTHDSSLIISSNVDSLLDEFAGELTLLTSIPPGIDETDCDPEEDIRLIERLFDSFMEEIDLSFTPDDPMPLGIEEDDYDSKSDILNLEELLDNYSFSLLENESFHFDIPSFSRPPAKPRDGNTGILNIKMMGDIFEQKVPIPGLTITRVSNQEKSPDLLSHRGLEIFQPFAKCPLMIHGKNIPILDVPLFHFYPLDQLKYGGNWVKLSDLKQALRGRHPMLIRICEDSYQRILSSKSSFPQLHLGNPVKDKQEKDKIGTKPDKNGKRGKARQCQSPVTIKKAEKEKKIQT
nr:hypothetical protein [Tanacetum cinerariifolium]